MTQLSPQSQEEYFKFERKLIGLVNHRILIYHYDAPFMDRRDTIQALIDASKRVKISAIIPASRKLTSLEKVTEGLGNIEVVRTDEELNYGWIVYGKIGVSMWNSQRKTNYLPETDKGVILRTSLVNHHFLNSYHRHLFDMKRARIKDKVSV